MDRYSYGQANEIALKLLPSGFTQIERGRNNWVFESGESILTIPRHERVKNYAIRVKATQFLAAQGIPVAEILDYSPEKEDLPEYLLVKKVEGANINLLVSSQKERKKVHQSAGEVLQAIHNLSCSGYGRLDKNLIGENKSWVNFTDDFFSESMRRVKLSPELYNRFGKLLEEEYRTGRPKITNSYQRSFLHADFHLGNLLFKDEKVSAVLDLDIVSSGDSCWDTGHYCHTFNVDRTNGVESFRKGYNRPEDLGKERLYCLMIWTRKIGSQAVQRPDALKETIPELEKILRGEI